ncbi:MAG: UDP-N-acetylmuramate--L-alanine ligase [Marinifilaceae bacterium]
MSFQNIKNVYLVGVGGIGMSALARYFNAKDFRVAGYDKVESTLTRNLVSEGISVNYEEDVACIANEYRDNVNTLVVYTPAIPVNNKQLNYFRDNNFMLVKRSQVLGMIAKEYRLIGVAGTHGKTTVSTMAAYLMKNSHLDCCAFLGGVSKNFNSNLVLEENSEWAVMEADEFDRSFLQLFPEIAVLTAMDADHLDIYGTEEELKRTFLKYVSQIKEGGKLVYKLGLDIEASNIDMFSYSIEDKSADFYLENIKIIDSSFEYDLVTPNSVITSLRLNYPGRVNLENSVAASAVAFLCGVTDSELRKALVSFQGVLRRFDLRYKSKDFMYIDDYAHHPDELRAVITSVRELYPNKKIAAVFQPHLYTRTRDFAKGFMESLNLLDELILLDIYPAREKPIVGVNSQMLLDGISIPAFISTKEDLIDNIESINCDILLTLGAGDIDRFVNRISNMLERNAN